MGPPSVRYPNEIWGQSGMRPNSVTSLGRVCGKASQPGDCLSVWLASLGPVWGQSGGSLGSLGSHSGAILGPVWDLSGVQ